MRIIQRLLTLWKPREISAAQPGKSERCTLATGLALYGACRYHDALRHFEGAILGGEVRAHSMRACCLQGLDRHDEAIDALTLAIENDPEDCNSFYLRAQSHHALGIREEAIADIQAAIRLAARDTPANREY